jgi:hypothetical protein
MIGQTEPNVVLTATRCGVQRKLRDVDAGAGLPTTCLDGHGGLQKILLHFSGFLE